MCYLFSSFVRAGSSFQFPLKLHKHCEYTPSPQWYQKDTQPKGALCRGRRRLRTSFSMPPPYSKGEAARRGSKASPPRYRTTCEVCRDVIRRTHGMCKQEAACCPSRPNDLHTPSMSHLNTRLCNVRGVPTHTTNPTALKKQLADTNETFRKRACSMLNLAFMPLASCSPCTLTSMVYFLHIIWRCCIVSLRLELHSKLLIRP